MTADEPPGLASQPSLQKRGGGGVLAEAQAAAARRQQALSGADRQHAAHSALANAASRRLVGGASRNLRDSTQIDAGEDSEITLLSFKIDSVTDLVHTLAKRMDQGSPSQSLLTPHADSHIKWATWTLAGREEHHRCQR